MSPSVEAEIYIMPLTGPLSHVRLDSDHTSTPYFIKWNICFNIIRADICVSPLVATDNAVR
jgi:hypothetical protein